MERPPCGIVQDLLLSYCEGLTGDSVTQMIQEHLAECPECQQRYEERKRQQEIAESEEASRGKNFIDKLKSIRFYVIGFVIGLTLPILVLALWFLLGMLKSYLMMFWL